MKDTTPPMLPKTCKKLIIAVFWFCLTLTANATGLETLEREFVVIPGGVLPQQIPVHSFEAKRFPVTRKQWLDVMREIPAGVPEKERATWNQCPDCPVTYVKWENVEHKADDIQKFVLKLNEIKKANGCVYDVPSNNELHYMIRGDRTGANPDPYSAGVTDQNFDEYFTHYLNSLDENQEPRVQPVGKKRPNAFGIELGNVILVTKDIYSKKYRYYGVFARGACFWDWPELREYFRSDFVGNLGVDCCKRETGFTLVRKCGLKN